MPSLQPVWPLKGPFVSVAQVPAKLLRLTAPETADVLSMSSLALICEYQSPAPSQMQIAARCGGWSDATCH